MIRHNLTYQEDQNGNLTKLQPKKMGFSENISRMKYKTDSKELTDYFHKLIIIIEDY